MTVFPGNFGTERGSHQGMVLLFDPESGSPIAIVEAREITAIRTAAASAIATDVLAPRDAAVLAVFGYGEQAMAHIDALLQVRPIRQVIVWGRHLKRAKEFADAAGARFPMGRWLRPGQHLNVVGSSIPTTAEIDHEAVVRSRFFVDFIDSALALAGEFRRARAARQVSEAHILGSIGEVLCGRAEGRRHAKEITLFKSLGMICEDLVSASFILAEAERLGIGQVVEF